MMIYEGATVSAIRANFPTINELIDFLRARREEGHSTFFYSLTVSPTIITLAYGDFR